MSILIKGMTMPTSCFRCPISVLNGERLFCEVTKDEVVRAKRASDCPLVPVPPHGDLIERNAASLTDFEIAVCDGSFREGMIMLLDKIDNAPTIIEAEIGKGDTEC